MEAVVVLIAAGIIFRYRHLLSFFSYFCLIQFLSKWNCKFVYLIQASWCEGRERWLDGKETEGRGRQLLCFFSFFVVCPLSVFLSLSLPLSISLPPLSLHLSLLSYHLFFSLYSFDICYVIDVLTIIFN